MRPAARLLDLTRLASRAALPPTGVDRVERAYLTALIADPAPACGLIRTAVGWLLLDKTGLAAFDAAIDARAFGTPRLFDRLARRRDPARAAVEGFLRRTAIHRSSHAGLKRLLARQQGGWYINVGQTSLRQDVLSALPAQTRVAVMVHDTIPLDHPQWQRPEAAEKLARIIVLTARHADLVIATADATAHDIARHLAAAGRVPQIVTAPLGVTLTTPDPAALPADIELSQPYFLCLNTLEPRKNHALLLDVWEAMGPDAPPLYLVGGKGWMVDDLMARLATTTAPVRHLQGLSDGAVAALLAGARAALNPSLAEGFGLPALEAAGHGRPLLCSPLPVWKELLGDWPVYLAADDRYLWQKAVSDPTFGLPQECPRTAPLPTWAAHFRSVFSTL